MRTAAFNTTVMPAHSSSLSAQIFDIKRFAIHDGPGIRTTVFLKGCPLVCSWCHNPESQTAGPSIVFQRGRCVGCGACVEVCPHGAVALQNRISVTDIARCQGCGACVQACPHHAREMVGHRQSLDSLLGVLRRDVAFYDRSGGGVTLSGGEPLSQPGFVLALLDRLRSEGIHTAVDTCGYASTEVIRSVAKLADLFLYDIKLLDPERHKLYTGVDNHHILENARTLSRQGASVWIRYPLIPGINDAEDDLRSLGRFAAELGSVKAIQLLPYHQAAEEKARRSGHDYDLQGILPPTSAEAERCRQRVQEEVTVPVSIGG